jgi:serine/threonine protein phosphatase PrpC
MSTALFHREPFIEWVVAAQPIPGQTVSGDLHLVKTFDRGALAAVVDGLGHGDEATAAAKAAVGVLDENVEQSVITLVKQCHGALINTRGAVMTVASFNAFDNSVSWLSVGNVEGVLMRADTKATPPAESTFLRGGVVGYQLPALRASVITVSPGDVLVLATDGIRSGFEQSVILTDAPQQIADRVMAQHFKGNDDALVLVVRFLGTRHE